MSRRLRQTLVVVVALSALALAGSALATRTVRIASQISIKSNALTFSGHVTSANSACKASRHVTLYRRFSDGTHQALGSTTTAASGRWKVTVSGSAGISLAHFYATVRRRSEGTAGTIYVCRSARSKTIAFHS